jgi:hypothetical protein
MADSTNLQLPYVEAAQAQKHVTHNEAIRRLDALVRTRVVSQGLTTPPAASDGEVYIPGSGATGAWSTWDFNLAYWVDGAWIKIVPKVGWIVYDIDLAALFMYVGAPLYWTSMLGGGLRERLAADRDYYVNAGSGDDGNDGLSSGTAFATIQKGIDTVAGIDLGGFTATINVADGSYANFVGKSLVGGNAAIVGNAGAPANVGVAHAGNGEAAMFEQCLGGSWHIAGMKLSSSSGFGLRVRNGSVVTFANLDFGANTRHIDVQGSAIVEALGNWQFSAGGTQAIRVDSDGALKATGRTVTISGTPAWTTFATVGTLGLLVLATITFSGAATGARYSVSGNGVLNTSGGGASYLPGDAAGSTATGGQYL